MTTLLVTGGAGFIGSAFVRRALADPSVSVVTLDALTYAGDAASLDGLPRHALVGGDVADRALVLRLLREHRPAAVVHLAAESHVDRSIDAPRTFVETNVLGTFELLEACRAWLAERSPAERDGFRFVHVSTDEVYGSLGATAGGVEARGAGADVQPRRRWGANQPPGGPRAVRPARRAGARPGRGHALADALRGRPAGVRPALRDASRAEAELGWRPTRSFEEALRETVRWYLGHRAWCERITSGVYRRERLGLAGEG